MDDTFSGQRWLVTGGGGQLGSHVVRQLVVRGVEPGAVLAIIRGHATGTAGVREERVDLAAPEVLTTVVRDFAPTHVVHLGAMTAVGACHAEPGAARQINVNATRVLADAATGSRLVFASTDMVFDGDDAPYDEDSVPTAVSQYGRSKIAAETALAGRDGVVVARLPLMYGLPVSDRESTFVQQVAALRKGHPLRLFTDEFRTPVWLADAARVMIGLACSDYAGVIHVAGAERLSRYDMVARVARVLGITDARMEAISRLDIDAAEPRPADLSLDGSRLAALFPRLVPGPMRAEVFQA